MRARITSIVVFAVALQTTACAPHYSGDGKFTDFGSLTAIDRYLVDLGPVDLSQANKRTFRMRGLPSSELVIGLRQINVSAGCDAAALAAERVRIDVTTSDGVVVVSEEAPLSAWITSSSVVYRRGVELQKPVSNGVVELVRTGVHSFGGWGTYFTPSSFKTYTAELEVFDAQGVSGCESRLVVVGGGWK